MQKIRCLSGNALKIIATIAMLIDHIGLLFFPNQIGFRIIGRLAFPIFAFMIAEGCRYTRSKPRYLLTVASLALVIQTVYYVVMNSLAMSIFITFSISIILIYSLQFFKKLYFSTQSQTSAKILSGLLFLAFMIGAYILNLVFDIDYGFAGCMLPVFASILHSDENSPKVLKKLDTLPANLAIFGAGLICLAAVNRPISYFALLSLPLLLLYSGKRGTRKLKYFFYLFYPLHLVVLYGIKLLIN